MTAALHDGELAASYARDGAEGPFQALVARHVDLVFATALRQTGNRGLAEEITQNVFIALARKAPRLTGYQTLAGWLHQTAVLESRSRIRSELRRKHREQTAAELAELRNDGGSAFAPLLPLLDEALLSLPSDDRALVIGRYMRDWSLAETGALLGIREDAARKRIARGLAKLARFFRKRGFHLSERAAGGAAALLGAAVHSAPAGLLASSVQCGLSAAGPAGGLNLLILQFMSASKIQIAALCVLIVSGPWFWQQRNAAKLNKETAQWKERFQRSSETLAEIERERARAAAELSRLEQERSEISAKRAALSDPEPGKPALRYMWNEASPLARIPKSLLKGGPFSAVTDRRGALTPEARELLQMTAAEAAQVQEAINSFLGSAYGAQQKVLQSVPPNREELQHAEPLKKSAQDVRAFKVGSIKEELAAYRETFKSSLRAVLGPERFPIFADALKSWIDLEENGRGMNTGMMPVFDDPFRIFFLKPEPGRGDLQWGLTLLGDYSGSLFGTIPVREIPEMFTAWLQDWIELSQAKQPL